MAGSGERVDLGRWLRDNKFSVLTFIAGLALGWFHWWTFGDDCSWLPILKGTTCSFKERIGSYYGYPMSAQMLSFAGASAFLGAAVDAMLHRNRGDKNREQIDNLLKQFVEEQRQFVKEQKQRDERILETLNGILVAIERANRPPADP